MTRAMLLAAVAAALAPFALADLLAARSAPRARRHPFAALLARLGRALGAPGSPDGLGGLLAAAGLADRVDPGDAMAIKAGAAVATMLAAVLPAQALPGRLGPATLLAAPIAGFLAPDLALRRRVRRRAKRMATELADVLDLLDVAIAAGLTPQRALAEVGRRHKGLLGRELHAAAARTALGVPHDEALRAFTRRTPIPAAAPLAAALARSAAHGAPLAEPLAALAHDARAEHARALKDRAARAAPKIQLTVALLLVPAAMLLVAAAMLASFA